MPKKSCTSNLLEYLETVSSKVDQGKNLDMVYLDFAKAFDLVPRKRLIEKLKAHGFTGELVKWIESWLTDRKQRVVINGCPSTWQAVSSGVPQGSILGPILFNIFINDLDEEVAATIVLKFADDTKIGQVIETVQDREHLQHCLDKLCDWADRWGMRFNVAKCHVMHFGHSNPKFTYRMNGAELAPTEEEKDLGVLVSCNLKVANQCDRAAQTATGVLAQILRAFTYRNKTTLPRLFRTYVRPHLEYAVQAWAPWQAGDIEKLEKVQKKMVAAVSGLKGNSYEDKLSELGMETLSARRRRLDLQQAYKILTEKEDLDPGTWFENIGERPRETRLAAGGQNLVQPRAPLDTRRNFFSVRVVEPWNSLPVSSKAAKTVYEFKKKLRN